MWTNVTRFMMSCIGSTLCVLSQTLLVLTRAAFNSCSALMSVRGIDTLLLSYVKMVTLQCNTAVKSWMLVCWRWRFNWLFILQLQLSLPPPSSLASIKFGMETFWYWLSWVDIIIIRQPRNCMTTAFFTLSLLFWVDIYWGWLVPMSQSLLTAHQYFLWAVKSPCAVSLMYFKSTEVNWWLLDIESTQQQELREDVKVLKSTIHRLNQELSRYQAQFRKLDDREVRCRMADTIAITLIITVLFKLLVINQSFLIDIKNVHKKFCSLSAVNSGWIFITLLCICYS